MNYYKEPAKDVPIKGNYDVVVVGAGTGGVIAALAAAAGGAKTALIEAKGYPGGIVVEGGTALHSFFNLWKAFPGVEKKQLVKGLPQNLVDRLMAEGGANGHCEMERGYDYDSVCTAIDTEIYKRVAFELIEEAGIHFFTSTLVVGAIMEGSRLTGLIAESRSGREAFMGKAFIDCSGYGDLSAFAGARFTEPNDYPVVNSIGVGGVSVEKYRDFLEAHGSLGQLAYGRRSGVENRIIRVSGPGERFPEELKKASQEIGLSAVITTLHDDYFMFLKLNYAMPASPTDRDAVTKAELELRRRQAKAIDLFRKYIPGCENAFIARSSPQLTVRRARVIECDYDITRDDVLEARHFDDDVFTYGFMDFAPRLQVKNGGSYGTPYRALCVRGIDNLYAAGMLITSDHDAHMSTRNTVACMGQGQAAGIAAALIARRGGDSRSLPYGELRKALLEADVYLEN